MATHSSVPAWRIPGTVEPGMLPLMGSHRVGHDWNDLAAAAAATAYIIPFMFSNLWTQRHTKTCVKKCPGEYTSNCLEP